MAPGKRYKKRKKKSRVVDKIIAVIAILIIFIAGLFTGVFITKMGWAANANEDNDDASLMTETIMDESGPLHENHVNLTEVQNMDKFSTESQISASTESVTETESSDKTEVDRDSWVETKLAEMEMSEKVAQLFFVAADTLSQVENTTVAGDVFKTRFETYPVGGIVLSGGNIEAPDQLKSFTKAADEISNSRVGLDLFIGVEEEGGSVLQIADKPEFGLNNVGSMTDIGAGDDAEAAYKAGDYIGSYLSEYGINVDFAPVADVIYNVPNSVVEGRAFGQDSVLVSDMVTKEVEGLQKWNVSAVLKHFPGHGTTEGDPTAGDAVSLRTVTELETFDYLPFRKGIEAGADFVMVGHIIMPNVNQEGVPASISSYFMTDALKNELGFDGIIITADMSMAAITNRLSPGDAAVSAINGGADMVFMTSDFEEAFEGVMDAALEGGISAERINESVRRILRIKYMKQYGR